MTTLEKLSNWNIKGYQQDLLKWYDENKRDLPWRRERDPYKIWVSEIMLQQTKVDTVIPYYNRFMKFFPTVQALAEAEEETVLKAWEGLGYYSRARNLHKAVKEVQENYGGQVPAEKEEVHKLSGVGPYTAGAILSIAFNIPAPAVDGNVMRVLSRIFSIYDDISKATTRKRFESIVDEIISKENPSHFNQALMELGALICTPKSPACLICPVQEHCAARAEGVQELLPVKAKKSPPKKKQMKAIVLKDDAGRILIQQRPETGMLAKLWQFPNIEAEEVVEDYADLKKHLLFMGLQVDIFEKVHEVRHVFTHLIWEIDVYIGELKGMAREADLELASLRLVEKGDVDLYPFPVSHQKINDFVLKKGDF
ncbi:MULTISPECIES: A/G-specific adenine glycosylase [Bacillaceae]|uniref:Adenine DNA glycosylase n=1 Tax=Evansella alkalicola TaxID=745819 RepID=A0ABS6JMT1_9BACI|nr:A/G-specific adenine glycosylase [Litchfieldia alkalitelluris]MBU9719867.1 A/G-specific adenine glycosylase [Bacillus alkalicola]